MKARTRGTLLLLVLVVSLVLWYATFLVLGLAGEAQAEPKLAPKPVPAHFEVAEPAWDKINVQEAL